MYNDFPPPSSSPARRTCEVLSSRDGKAPDEKNVARIDPRAPVRASDYFSPNPELRGNNLLVSHIRRAFTQRGGHSTTGTATIETAPPGNRRALLIRAAIKSRPGNTIRTRLYAYVMCTTYMKYKHGFFRGFSLRRPRAVEVRERDARGKRTSRSREK